MTDSCTGIFSLQPLKKLVLWRDPVARSGAEAMAADEALLEWKECSVLRVYKWGLQTVTYGCFDSEAEARAIFPSEDLEFVRRWTGGGIVDHRHDIPFTLALRHADREGRPTSASLYRWIHGALALVLRENKIACIMLTGDAPNGGRACFSSPVTSDLTLPNGDKLAGGGQRRATSGILHQGSIQNCSLSNGWDESLAHRLAEEVIISSTPEPFLGFQNRVEQLNRDKYSTLAWQQGGRRRELKG